jgi:hypothetical protein
MKSSTIVAAGRRDQTQRGGDAAVRRRPDHELAA